MKRTLTGFLVIYLIVLTHSWVAGHLMLRSCAANGEARIPGVATIKCQLKED